jgi:hypothetical protein
MTQECQRMKLRMVPPPGGGGHHPKYNQQCLIGWEPLWNLSLMLHEEIGLIEWHGK